MANFNNSFDYNVKLLGLLPVRFDFSKEENIGVRLKTDKLRKIKKPSEDHHEGEMIDAQLLQNTAVVEAKTIHHNNPNNIPIISDGKEVASDEDTTHTAPHPTTEAKEKSDDGSEDVTASVSESVQKLKIQNDVKDEREDVNDQTNDKQMEQESVEDESTEPVDKTMKEDLSAKFLYRCYYDVNGQQPDFLTYRLPLMFLAIEDEPYFFKVNKIKFKPYGCDNEMEFIQIQWPIQLNQLYNNPKYDVSNHKGWSGPMFNKWVTTNDSEQKESSPSVEPAPSSEAMSHAGDDEKRDHDNVKSGSNSSYHRAYIQAELKPKSERDGYGIEDATRGFNILITALVGGVWDLEEDPNNYTCKHLAEMRTVQEKLVRETQSHGPNSFNNNTFYKRVRMLSNYWQCYLAGETNYLVGVNGPIMHPDQESAEVDTKKHRQINELRLYDVSKIPDFIKRSAAEQGFLPWSKEILQNRLYKSLHIIYDKVKDAPVDTEFMFVKYNQFDPPIHDVDGSITDPYLLAFKQLIIEGLPTPSQPNLVENLMKFMKYDSFVEFCLDRKFKFEDVPKKEEKESSIILTFQNECLQDIFLQVAGSMLKYLKKNDKFPADCGMENLSIEKVFMRKPVPSPHRNPLWRNSNHHQQQQSNWNNNRTPTTDSRQSWRSSNNQPPQSGAQNHENNWRRAGDSAGGNFQSWRSSNHEQQEQQPNLQNDNWRQQGASMNSREYSRNIDDSRRQRYDEQSWRRK